MADSDKTPASSAPPATKKPPGRPRQPAAESHKQRIERLQDELRQAQAALKVSEERRAAIVGAAALRHTRHNTEFARQLAAALRTEVKAKADRALIADLLTGNTVDSGKTETTA